MSDNEQVRQVLQQYIDGTQQRDTTALAAVFHAQAVMNGYLAGQLVVGGPDSFIETIASAPPSDPAYQAQITALQVDGDIASAIVSEKALLGLDFINHFQLLRQNDEWCIVAKLFQGKASE